MIVIAEKNAPDCTTVLRPMEYCDFGAVLELRNTVGVRGVSLRSTGLVTLGKHLAWMHNVVVHAGLCGWVMMGRTHGQAVELLGTVSYRRLEGGGAVISLAVKRRATRQGIATRMVTETVDEALEILDVRSVRAAVLTSNIPSRMLFFRLGWEYVGFDKVGTQDVEIRQYPVGVVP